MALGDVVDSGTAGTGGGTSLSPSLAGTAASGNLLVVCAALARSPSTLTGPSGYALIGESGSSGNLSYGLWWKESAGTETGATVSWTDNGSGAVSIVEYDSAGLDLSALDASGEDLTNESTSVTSQASGSASNSQNTAFAVVLIAADLATGIRDGRTYSNSFVEDINQVGSNNSRAGGYIASKVLSATGSNTTTLSSSDSGAFATGAIAVWSAAGGGGGSTFQPAWAMNSNVVIQ